MSSTRCAVCKYFRRRCPTDCIFSPYFPPNNPQRFACVHRIYGASNIGKMLEQIPIHLRGDAVESLYYEAKCRIQDPVYGCVGIISLLHQQIHNAQNQLAKAQAEIAVYNAGSLAKPPPVYQYYHSNQPEEVVVFEADVPSSSFNNLLPQENTSVVAMQLPYATSNFP